MKPLTQNYPRRIKLRLDVNPTSVMQQHANVTVCLDEAAARELEMKDNCQFVYENKPEWQKV